jgi:hypothetical protein
MLCKGGTVMMMMSSPSRLSSDTPSAPVDQTACICPGLVLLHDRRLSRLWLLSFFGHFDQNVSFFGLLPLFLYGSHLSFLIFLPLSLFHLFSLQMSCFLLSLLSLRALRIFLYCIE